MLKILKQTLSVFSYMFRRKGFFTKKLVVSTVTLMMMLFIDIKCGIWDGMGLCLLVLLTFYVICNYIIRYLEMKREDDENNKKDTTDSTDIDALTDDFSSGSDEKENMGDVNKEEMVNHPT